MGLKLLIGLGVGVGALALASDSRAGRLPTTYDHIFRAECSAMPIGFMRSLAWNESRMQADEDTQGSRGILQIVEEMRSDYNRTHGTSHSRADLFDPRINARMACWVLGFIVRSYRAHHSNTFPSVDWNSANFVQLLTLGWNAGFSEAAGVGHVIGILEAEGNSRDHITVDAVRAAARRIGGVASALRTRSTAWPKLVWQDYRAE